MSSSINKSISGVHTVVEEKKEEKNIEKNIEKDIEKNIEKKEEKNVEHIILKPQKILKEKFRLDYKIPDFVIEHVDIVFQLNDEDTKVSSKLTMYRRDGCALDCDLKLDGEDLKLKRIEIDDKEIVYGLYNDNDNNNNNNNNDNKNDKNDNNNNNKGYIYNEDSNSIIIHNKYIPNKAFIKFTVYTEVNISPIKNLQLMGLYKTGKLFCTQCEAEGFRRITYFIDRPDIMATYRVRIESDKKICPIMLSNGNLIEKNECEENKNYHYAIFDDPHPKPSYLFALIAGDLHSIQDTFITKSGRSVHLEILSEKDDVKKLNWAMHSIKKAFKWDEETFNLEYDLDFFYIVCARDFNMGAMENKGLNVFNTALLLADDKTTDAEYQRIMNVIGHEYFHNWTGNRVTCRDWFQLTLKEGLTVFRDQKFTGDMYSHVEKRIEDIHFLKSRQFNEDNGPISHPIRPESYIAMDNFYTATVYDKGAEVIRMYHTILGDEGFKKGMRLYFERHDGQAVTCDDFRFAMADANNYDLSLFERWYFQAGTPVVEVLEAMYIQEEKKYKITFSQMTPVTPRQPVKFPLHIPIRIGLIGKNSKKNLIDNNTILHLRSEKQTFEIEGVEEDCVPSILRDFSAPVKLKNNLEQDEDLAFLMAYDSDEFNKWESGQKFGIKIILERLNIFKKIYNEYIKNEMKEKKITSNEYELFDDINNEYIYNSSHFKKLPSLFIQSFKSLLTAQNQEMALQAYSLALPDEDTVSQEMRPLDPILVHKAVQSVRREVYSELKEEIYELYKKLCMPDDYVETLEKKDVARRKLRNILLYYLTSYKDNNAADIAYNHYSKSKNITDRICALRYLLSIDSPQRQTAIDDFYAFADGDALTIDKWFALQASSDREDCVEIVKELKKQKDFNYKNPNRFRSLFYAFARNNAHFNKKNGEGYILLADNIIEIDKINPQIAAGACNNLIMWKKLDDEYKFHMKKQLQRIFNTPGLSNDTHEICLKGLAE